MKLILPGLGLAVALALVGKATAGWLGSGVFGGGKSPVSATLLAILLGIAIRNLMTLPAAFHPGVSFALKRVLRAGIVILGIRLSLNDLGSIGLSAVPVAIMTVVSALVIVTWLGQRMGVPVRLATLIAVGTGVCGTTAIMATAPTIAARDDEVCYAVACITLFGLLAMMVYPFAAHFIFAGNALHAGVFLGTAVHDTAQVAGAGLVYQQNYATAEVLETATVTKLVRNLGMLAVIPAMSVWYRRQSDDGADSGPWYRMVPLFVIGFALMSVLRTAGDALHGNLADPGIWVAVVGHMETTATFLLTVAMAAVGLNTDIGSLRDTGWRPLLVGLFSALLVGGVSIAAIAILL